MKSTYLLYSLGLVSAAAANIIGRHPEESESVSSENNIFDEIINNNNRDDNSRNNKNTNDLNNLLQGFQGVNLNDLNIDGLNFGNIDLNNQDALAQGILSLLAGFCVNVNNNAFLNQNNLLNLGLNNELELFLELAQLAQLQQLGFLNGNGLGGLFNSGALFAGAGGRGFNIGVFKREIANMKKNMKRTKLRRGGSFSKNQCAQFSNSSSTTTAVESVATATSTAAAESSSSSVAVEAAASTAVASSTTAGVEVSSTAAATSTELPEPPVPQETSDIVTDNPEG